MYYEVGPVGFQKADTPVLQRMGSLTALQLGAFEGTEYYRTHPLAAFALIASVIVPSLIKTNMSLTDPGSGLSQSLTSFGLLVDQRVPSLASLGLAVEALLANAATIRTPSPIPIIRTCQEILALTTQGLLLSSGAVGLLRKSMSERHLQKISDGVAPVAGMFPVRTVYIGDHQIVDGIQRARIQTGLAPNPSVFIDPTRGPHRPVDNIPYGCRYRFRSQLEEVDDRHRYHGGRVRTKPPDVMGLKRAGTLFASTRLPGHPLFADRDHSACSLYGIETMMNEMSEIWPDMWREKLVILDTPRSEHMGRKHRDGVAGVSRATGELGAQAIATDAEGIFIGEVSRILRERHAIYSAVSEGDRGNGMGFSIAIAPTSGADTGEINRMAEALRTDTPDMQIAVSVLSEGIQEGDSSHDMILVTGPDSNDVYGTTNEAVAVGRAEKRVLFPVVFGAVDAHRLAKVDTTCFDVAHAIVESAYQQPNQ